MPGPLSNGSYNPGDPNGKTKAERGRPKHANRSEDGMHKRGSQNRNKNGRNR